MFMKNFRRRKASDAADAEESPVVESMSFRDAAGRPILIFSPDVVASLRRMATKMVQKDGFPRRLALTSALSGEGVTYTALALGTILANDVSARICVVDLNWWSPSDLLPVPDPEGKGIADAVSGSAMLQDILIETGQENLWIMPAGAAKIMNRPFMARSDKLKQLIDEAAAEFDHLVLDVPAILTTSDAIALSSLASHVALIVHQGVTPIEKVRLAMEDIAHLNISGVILNQVQAKVPQFLVNLIPQV